MTKTEKAIRDLCSHYADWYPSVSQIRELIALAQPEQDCTRSHPHEEMSKKCELRTEIARLTNCLARANAQAEHFEREWYLRGDEIERLKAQPEQNLNCKSVQARLATAWGYVKAEQEPVAWLDEYGNTFPLAAKQYSVVGKHWKPLYTAPPQRKPLSDEQIGEIGRKYEKFDNQGNEFFARWGFARAIEAAHGIKE